jgi:hypothetical protein
MCDLLQPEQHILIFVLVGLARYVRSTFKAYIASCSTFVARRDFCACHTDNKSLACVQLLVIVMFSY